MAEADKEFTAHKCYAQAQAARDRAMAAGDKETEDAWREIAAQWELLGNIMERGEAAMAALLRFAGVQWRFNRHIISSVRTISSRDSSTSARDLAICSMTLDWLASILSANSAMSAESWSYSSRSNAGLGTIVMLRACKAGALLVSQPPTPRASRCR